MTRARLKVIYHVVQKALWDAAQAAGVNYFPLRYEIEGFIHATHEANLLLSSSQLEAPGPRLHLQEHRGHVSLPRYRHCCARIACEDGSRRSHGEQSEPGGLSAHLRAVDACELRDETNGGPVRGADGTFLSIEGTVFESIWSRAYR